MSFPFFPTSDNKGHSRMLAFFHFHRSKSNCRNYMAVERQGLDKREFTVIRLVPRHRFGTRYSHFSKLLLNLHFTSVPRTGFRNCMLIRTEKTFHRFKLIRYFIMGNTFFYSSNRKALLYCTTKCCENADV